MRLFGVRDNALFSEQPKQQAAKLYQQFFRFVDDVGIVHIAGEPPLPPLIFDGVVDTVWVGDGKNLAVLGADIQTIFFCRLAIFDAFKIRRVNKIFRQSIEPLIEDMAVDHIALEIIQIDVVEKGAVVDEQDVPVIAACFAVELMQMHSAPFDCKADALALKACAIVIDQIAGQNRHQSICAGRPPHNALRVVQTVDSPLFAALHNPKMIKPSAGVATAHEGFVDFD